MNSEPSTQHPEPSPRLSIGLRLSAWLVRLNWRLQSTPDAVKFSMATAHCGYYHVNEAVNQLRQRGEPVTWESLAAYLPAATTFFVERRYARLLE